jgi:hypothetical protein
VGAHLPKFGHGLTGDDLIVVKSGDKAEGLELTLSLLQLPKDQGPEDLHVLKRKGRMMETSWREGARWQPISIQLEPWGHCPTIHTSLLFHRAAHLFHSNL